MKYTSAFLRLAAVTILLAACAKTPEPVPAHVVTPPVVSAPAEVLSTYQGLLQKAGVSVFMEGTHRLETSDLTEVVLLRSTNVDLDAYLGSRVSVEGYSKPTVERGGVIVDVESLIELSPPAMLEPLPESSSSSSSAEVMSSSSFASSPTAPAAIIRSSSSSSSTSSFSSIASSPVSSVAASSPATSTTDARVALMAKAKTDAANFTQVFCSRHAGFCVPIHKSWYYNSFGATSSYLWHVEVSSEEVAELGDGPLVINLATGSLDASIADGSVVTQGDFVIGYRQWTNGRHFEVSAPAALRSAVAYITENISVYLQEGEASTSSSASSSSASSL